ncbi:MAG TPA: hypothetical protein PK829_13610, partial [Promineifilum sp.]|nr:hypothetical protein [Promineifilum sp.]
MSLPLTAVAFGRPGVGPDGNAHRGKPARNHGNGDYHGVAHQHRDIDARRPRPGHRDPAVS